MLLVVLMVAACAAAAVVAGVVVVRGRRGGAVDPSPQPTTAEWAAVGAAAPEPGGLTYGLIGPPGPDYAPQPVFSTAATVASFVPHRPVVTSPAGTRVRPARRGAHRRGTDAEEVARLEALFAAGTISEDEMTSLKARLS